MSESSEVAVLVAVLARQMGAIDDQQLTRAAASWNAEQDPPFDQWLETEGLLDSETAATLRQLARKQLQEHQGSASESIGTIYQRAPSAIPESLIKSLDQLQSGDLWSTLMHMAPGATEAPATESTGDRQDRSARFHKVREHAQGGLGQVFVAIDDELNRQVALKQIQDRFSGDKEARQRFLLEAEITGGLEHPGVVPVYGLGMYDDGDPYYAMRFIRGESMEEAITSFHRQSTGSPFESKDSQKSFEFRKLLGRLVDVCQAIAYAHSRGVLHRDIKPDNIMLGKFGETLVVDWGLAKISEGPSEGPSEGAPEGASEGAPEGASDDTESAESEELGEGSLDVTSGDATPATPSQLATDQKGDTRLNPLHGRDSAPTQMGRIVGTPGYMSPEQAKGEIDRLDERSDVYSLGATLYSLLVGRPAFASRDNQGQPLSVKSVLDAVRNGRFEPPRAASPAIPKPLAAICERAMAQAPDDRYTSPLELADEIERWLSDEPVEAYRENFVERSRRWIKRHQSLAASVLAIVLVSTVGLVSFSLVLRQKNHDLQIAEAQAKREAATSRAVTEFMNDDLLGQASPKDHPNPHLEVRTVLDRAADSLDTQFQQQPLVKANLLRTIGVAYGYLGEYAKSTPALVKSVELYVKHSGSNSHATLEAKSELGAALAVAGDYTRAEQTLRDVLQLQIKHFGPNDKSVLDTQAELADLLTWTGNFEEAERLIKKAIEGNRRMMGPRHADTLSCEATLVNIWNQGTKRQEAMKLGIDLLERTEEALGPEHMYTLEILTLNAQTWLYLEEDDKAKAAYRRALELARRLHGEDHPSTLALRSDVAVMQSSDGNLLESHQTLVEIYTKSLEIFGPLHRESIVSALHLSNSLAGLERHEESKALLLETLPRAEQVLGHAHNETQYIRLALAWASYHLGESEQAVAITKEVEAAQADPQTPSDAVLDAWTCRAEIHYDKAEFDEAITLLQWARQGYLKLQSANSIGAVRANNDLLWAYVGANQYEQADALLDELVKQQGYRLEDLCLARLSLARAFADAEQHERTNHLVAQVREWAADLGEPRLRDLEPLYELASLLYDVEMVDESIVAYQHVLEHQKRILGPHALPVLDSMADLAGIFEAEERYDEAETLYRELVASTQATLGPHDDITLAQLESLAALLLAQDKHEAALEVLETLREALAATSDDYLIQVNAARAEAFLSLERFAEAAEAFGSAVTLSNVTEGEEDEQMLLWLHQWAHCLDSSGQDQRAIPIYERVVRGRSRVFGRLHQYTLKSLQNVIVLAAEVGDQAKVKQLRDDLTDRIKQLDVGSEDYANSTYSIGQAFLELKQWDQAAEWFQRCLTSRTKSLGDGDESTLLAMHQVAYCHQQSGRFDDAVDVYKDVVKGRSEALGATHEHTRLSLANWANIEYQRERYEQALPLLKDLLRRTIEAEGTASLATMLPRVNLAMVQFMLGQVDESILQYRETLEIAYRRLPKDKEDDAQAKTGVAVLLIALADAELADERFEDAWLHAKEGHDMLKKIVPDHWQTYRAQSVMGGVHVARKQHEQAVPLLLAAFAKINEAGYRPEMEQRYRLDVAQRLVAAYEGLSQSEEAKKWRRIVDDLK